MASDELAHKIARRLWLNNVLRWIMRRSGFTHDRKEMIRLIADDVEALDRIPEASEILTMLQDDWSEQNINCYIRYQLQ